MKNKKSSLKGMTNSLCDGDIQLLAVKISVTFQAVGDYIEPQTPDDYFIRSVYP